MLPIKSKVRGTVGLNFYWGIGVLWHLMRYKLHKDEFDVIHAHCSGVAAPLIIGVCAKYILRKPLIYTIHCCRVSTYHPMSKLDSMLNQAVINIEKYCLKKADHVITLTTDRETSYSIYFKVANELYGAYNDLREEMALEQYGKSYNDLNSNQRGVVSEYYKYKVFEAKPIDGSSY